MRRSHPGEQPRNWHSRQKELQVQRPCGGKVKGQNEEQEGQDSSFEKWAGAGSGGPRLAALWRSPDFKNME